MSSAIPAQFLMAGAKARGRGETAGRGPSLARLPNESCGRVHVNRLLVPVEQGAQTLRCVYVPWLAEQTQLCVSCWVASGTSPQGHATILKFSLHPQVETLTPFQRCSACLLSQLPGWPFFWNGCQRRQSLLERSNLLLNPGSAPARHFPRSRDFGTNEVKGPTLFTVLPGLRVCEASRVTNLACYQSHETHENKLLGLCSPIIG